MTSMAVRARHSIIGTAGHIDHGKTALVRALTGQDTDRLKEEKERGISIDLGFAYFTLPNGERVGIVDVPGHERFIRNMLAGAHGIDLALFTVAGDDGVMPQSEEHLDILHLLGVERGIFVITKADLVDQERLAEVREEIEVLADGTRLQGAPIIAVSSVTGYGIDQLKAEMVRQLDGFAGRVGGELFRLPVDRAFVIKGHGVVVTGTAMSGTVSVGQKLRLLPCGELVRVRSVQVHSTAVERATAGQRVALNLSGSERSEVRRGDVVVDERLDLTTTRLDAALEVRPLAKRPVKTNDTVRLFAGTSEALGRVIVLEEGGEIAPKCSGLVQFVLRAPIVVLRGDRFVVRDAAGQRTIGGGAVINPLGRRSRKEPAAYRNRLAALKKSSDAAAIAAMIELQEALALDAARISHILNLPLTEVQAALDAPIFSAVAIGDEVSFTTVTKWNEFKRFVLESVAAFHQAHPLAAGMEMEALRMRSPYQAAPRLFRTLIDRLAAESELERDESILRLRSHRVELAGEDRKLAAAIEAALEAAGFQPPDVRQLISTLKFAGVSDARFLQLLEVLERERRIVRIAKDLYFSSSAVKAAQMLLLGYFKTHNEISAAVFRDLLQASRKFAIALLDYFDHSGFTLRVGDMRRLRAAGGLNLR
jgi:selenocysteine-specific elongation factor